MKNLYFYTTAGCCLCDQAENLLSCLKKVALFDYEIVDIAGSDLLIHQYGIRIPVLQDKESLEEIGWPFSSEQLLNWLNTISNHVEFID